MIFHLNLHLKMYQTYSTMTGICFIILPSQMFGKMRKNDVPN